jgi:hypothetical protein
VTSKKKEMMILEFRSQIKIEGQRKEGSVLREDEQKQETD